MLAVPVSSTGVVDTVGRLNSLGATNVLSKEKIMIKIISIFTIFIALTWAVAFGLASGFEKVFLNDTAGWPLGYAAAIVTSTLLFLMFTKMIDRYVKSLENKGFTVPKLYPQTITAFMGVGSFIGILPIIFEVDPKVFFSGLGAYTAIFLLVFKDIIFSVVSGVSLTLDGSIRLNDMITIPNQNISGKVIEIGMRGIKLENEDKNIIVIPTYELSRSAFIKISPKNQIQ